MITQEQIEQAAFEYAGQIAETDKRLLYAEDFIAGAQWALEQDQWIDCKERLPSREGWYLVNIGATFFHFLFKKDIKAFVNWENEIVHPSYWMKLSLPKNNSYDRMVVDWNIT